MSRDRSLVLQLRDLGAPLKPECRYQHIAPLTSLIAVGAPLEVVRLFLAGGADPNFTTHATVGALFSSHWYAPLFRAIRRESSRYQEALIRLLLQYGADPMLVKSAPELRFRDTALTPVMLAIEHDALRVAEILLDHGAGSGWHPTPEVLYSPLQLAAYEDREEWVRLFLDKGADPNDVRPDRSNRQKPLYYDTKDYIGTPIQSAVVAGNLTIVHMLLKANAHPDLTTPLTPHTALQIACRKKSDAITHLLIEYGADINAPPAERRGATALQFAAINCRLELAHILVQKGADVNAPPAAYEGRTALEGAAEHGRIDMVQYLVNVGADISGDQYERALQRSRSNGHFATWNLLVSYLS